MRIRQAFLWLPALNVKYYATPFGSQPHLSYLILTFHCCQQPWEINILYLFLVLNWWNPIGSSGGGLDTDLVSYVFIQVTVWRASVSVLCCVGQSLPAIVRLVPCAEGPTQAFHRSLLRTVLCRSWWSLMMEIMPQIFQIQCPWPQLLPVHSLEGHDAM